MSEAEEGVPERDGDGGSRRPAAGVVERAASSAAVGQAATRAAVEVSASKTAAGEAAASEDLEEASATELGSSREKNQPQEPGRRPCKKGLCDQCRRT